MQQRVHPAAQLAGGQALLELGGRYWSLIRERVIPPASRSEFDRFAEQNLVMLTMEREG